MPAACAWSATRSARNVRPRRNDSPERSAMRSTSLWSMRARVVVTSLLTHHRISKPHAARYAARRASNDRVTTRERDSDGRGGMSGGMSGDRRPKRRHERRASALRDERLRPAGPMSARSGTTTRPARPAARSGAPGARSECYRSREAADASELRGRRRGPRPLAFFRLPALRLLSRRRTRWRHVGTSRGGRDRQALVALVEQAVELLGLERLLLDELVHDQVELVAVLRE